MKLAKVLGTVVATEKDAKLGGLRFLMLGEWGHDNKPAGGSVVAVDAVGAGVGEMAVHRPAAAFTVHERTLVVGGRFGPQSHDQPIHWVCGGELLARHHASTRRGLWQFQILVSQSR